jgi:glutathione S-transferase
MKAMIDLYYWTTPNGHKITIFLEETALPYRIVPVNIGKGEQFKPDFLAISPNNRMPAIVDHNPKDGRDPISVFESGAILVYLVEKRLSESQAVVRSDARASSGQARLCACERDQYRADSQRGIKGHPVRPDGRGGCPIALLKRLP